MLARTRLVKRQRLVRRLVSEFDRLEPLPRGVFSCPAGSGAVIVAIFRYASTPDDRSRSISTASRRFETHRTTTLPSSPCRCNASWWG
jgi:hypothetical protein